MKITIAIDSFKDSLTSLEAAEAIESGIKSVYKNAEIDKVPIADGGEGTVDALIDATNGKKIHLVVKNPLMENIKASYGILGNGETAVIEMAAASGLTLIPSEKRNPWHTTTFGTGEIILDALKKGCRKFIVGIGGSATNDAGMGMLRALGYKFYNHLNVELKGSGRDLIEVKKIDDTNVVPEIKKCEFLIACDVDNPFHGKNGASYIYAKQKGAGTSMIEDLDKGLRNFANEIFKHNNCDISNIKGAGAAGGLGGAFLAFLGGELKPGIEIIIKQIDLESKIKNSQYVITGEGKIDSQSVMGKTPVGVAKYAKKAGAKVIGITGTLGKDYEKIYHYGVDCVFSIINKPMKMEEALKKENAYSMLKDLSKNIFKLLKI